jgi:GGDEF domain-containing protein
MSSSSAPHQPDTAQSLAQIIEQVSATNPVQIQICCSQLPTRQAWMTTCQELRAHVSPTIDVQIHALDSPNPPQVHLLISDRPPIPSREPSGPVIKLWITPPSPDTPEHAATALTAPSELMAHDALKLPSELQVPAAIAAPERLRLLHLLVRQAVQQQTIHQLYERWQQAERLAEIDDLTQLPNRRAWWREFPRRLTAARQHHQPLSIVLFDLQQFKQVNDRLGLSAGDQLLGTLARNWQAACRTDEFLARIGGDEFAGLLPLVGAEALFTRLSTIVPQIITPQPLAELLPSASTEPAISSHSNLPHLPAVRIHWAAAPCDDESASPTEIWLFVERELMRRKIGASVLETVPTKKSWEKI